MDIGLVPMLFHFPSGRTLTSYYAPVHPLGLALFASMAILIIITYFVFIRRDGNISQTVGWILLIMWVLIFGGPALTALRSVGVQTFVMAFAYLFSSSALG